MITRHAGGATGLTVRVFGEFELTGPEGRLAMRSSRGAALIARLALAGERGVGADVLVDALWPADDGRSGTGALRVLVNRLRRDLDVAGNVIETIAGGYRLCNNIRVDVRELETALAAQPVDVESVEEWADSLTKAPLLGLDDFPFRMDFERRLLDTQASSIAALADHWIARGALDRVVRLLADASSRHPYDERLIALLVSTLAATGRQREALLVAQDCRARLRDLGLAVGEAVRDAEVAALNARMPTVDHLEPTGRSSAWIAIEQGFETLASGVGACVTVTGGPGLGKTFLADRVAERALAAGHVLLRASAHQADADSSLAAVIGTRVVDAAGGFEPLPFLPRAENGPTDAELTPYAVLRLVRETLMEIDGAIVLVVDNVQWADRDSLAVLRGACVEARYRPLLIVLTSRTPERWHDIVGDSLRIAVDLEPLDPETAMDFASDYLGRPLGPRLRAVIENAGGNPLLVVELLRGFIADGQIDDVDGSAEVAAVSPPATIRELTGRRRAQLPTSCRHVVDAAAVVGGEPAVSLVAEVAGVDVSSVEDALATEAGLALATIEHGRVRFAHDLVRDAFYEHIEPSARQVLHRRTSSILLRRHTSAGAAAMHAALGGVDITSMEFQQLRQRALVHSLREPMTTLAVVDQALAHASLSVDDRLLMQLARAEAYAALGRFDEAVEVASALVHAGGFETDRVLLRLAGFLLARGEATAVGEVFENWTVSEGLAGRARAVRALASFQAMAADDAREFADQALAASGGDGRLNDDPVAASIAHGVHARLATLEHRYADGRRRGVLSLEFANADDTREAHQYLPHFLAGLTSLDLDDRAGVADALTSGRAVASSFGQSWALPLYDGLEASMAYRQGDYVAASRAATRSIEADTTIEPSLAAAWTRSILALIAVRSGATEPAHRLADEAEAEVARGCLLGIDLVALARHDLQVALGDLDTAFETVRGAWELLSALRVRSCLPLLAVPLVRGALRSGAADVLDMVLDEVAVLADRSAHPPHVGTMQWATGLASGDAARVAEAAKAFASVGRSIEADDARRDAIRLARRR